MEITINGEQNAFETTTLSILELLEFKKVESPEMVAVQLNGVFVEVNNYPSTSLKSGDNIEFLYFMGGGSR